MRRIGLFALIAVFFTLASIPLVAVAADTGSVTGSWSTDTLIPVAGGTGGLIALLFAVSREVKGLIASFEKCNPRITVTLVQECANCTKRPKTNPPNPDGESA